MLTTKNQIHIFSQSLVRNRKINIAILVEFLGIGIKKTVDKAVSFYLF
jgi:hypothetical protein